MTGQEYWVSGGELWEFVRMLSNAAERGVPCPSGLRPPSVNQTYRAVMT